MRVNWDEIAHLCGIIVRQLEVGRFTQIVGVSRGGLIPAGIISQLLDIKDVHIICVESYDGKVAGKVKMISQPFLTAAHYNGDRTLVVDDICDTGSTFNFIQKLFLPRASYAAMYAKPKGAEICQHVGRIVDSEEWVEFPWEKKKPKEDVPSLDGALDLKRFESENPDSRDYVEQLMKENPSSTVDQTSD